MNPGFRIADSFGPGHLIVDDRCGFAAGVPRCRQLPISACDRELPLDFWVRLDELPIKIGYRWFPTNTAGSPAELVEAVVGEICLKRSFDSPAVGRGFPDQLAQWNVDAAASTLYTRPVGLIQTGCRSRRRSTVRSIPTSFTSRKSRCSIVSIAGS